MQPGSEQALSEAELTGRMAEGQAAFERRDFYQAHEIWEGVWNLLLGPERRWVQALIQIAVARYKLEQGRPDLCARLLQKALVKLEGAPASIHGVDLHAARSHAERLLRE